MSSTPTSASTAAPAQAFARAKRSSPNNFTRRHKKALPSKGRAFLLSIPKWICRLARNPGPIHPYGLSPQRIHNRFPADFNGRSRFRRPLITIHPEAFSKGISRKGRTHRTIAAEPCIAGHRKTRVQGFSANEPFRLQNLSIILNLEHRNIAGEA